MIWVKHKANYNVGDQGCVYILCMCHAVWSQHADTFGVKGNKVHPVSFTPHFSSRWHSHFQLMSSRTANELTGLTHIHKNHNLLSNTKFMAKQNVPFFFFSSF